MNGDKTHDGPQPPMDGIDFTSLPWNLNLPETHSYIHLTTSADWSKDYYDLEKDEGKLLEKEALCSYEKEPLQLTPATTSLNYGTTIWEGLKCYRLANGSIVVFRPDRNYERMKNGAYAMGIPMPSREIFLRAIQRAIQENSHIVPPAGDGMKLYLRPMLLGSGQQLGLYPSPRFSFVVYVSPTGNYFKSATTGLNLHLELTRCRAAVGGTGSVKCSGNYATTLRPLLDCKKHGFQDNLYLELDTYNKSDGVEGLGKAMLQELSAANIFLVLKTGEIVTPSLDRGTILPGVTRESVLDLINTYSSELQEAMKQSLDEAGETINDGMVVRGVSRTVTVNELSTAAEVFCTGTAAELVPVRRIATSPDDLEQVEFAFPHGSKLPGGPVTARLLSMLREAMYGDRAVDKKWLRNPYDTPKEFCA